MRSTKEIRSQLEAAYTLLNEDNTTLEKIDKVKSLLTGINPELDKKLAALGTATSHLKALGNLDVIHFGTHALSTKSPEAKKRKKLLLAFLLSWRSLKGEVKRVQGYYNNQSNTDITSTTTVATVAKTSLFAKGPFGIITGAAVIIVATGLLLRQATTTIQITNVGCAPLSVPAELPFKIPGLKVPTSPIVSGAPSSATLPALTVDVRSTNSTITATIFGQSASYSLPSGVTNINFDGISLLNTATTLKLSTSKSHVLIISCN